MRLKHCVTLLDILELLSAPPKMWSPGLDRTVAGRWAPFGQGPCLLSAESSASGACSTASHRVLSVGRNEGERECSLKTLPRMASFLFATSWPEISPHITPSCWEIVNTSQPYAQLKFRGNFAKERMEMVGWWGRGATCRLCQIIAKTLTLQRPWVQLKRQKCQQTF